MKEIVVQLFGAFSELDPQREISVPVEGGQVIDLRRALRALLQQRFPQVYEQLVLFYGVDPVVRETLYQGGST